MVGKPNVTASMYDGEFQLIVECPPSGRCRLTRFYMDPPEDDSECIYARPGQGCACPASHAAAIKELRKKLDADLQRITEEAGL